MVPIIGQGRWDRDAIAYFARVQADGGVIVSDMDVNNAIKHAKQHGYWSSVAFWTSAQFGVKKDGANAVSKLYCLKGNDAAQTTGSAQPTWTANQQNGRATLAFANLDYLDVALSEAWGTTEGYALVSAYLNTGTSHYGALRASSTALDDLWSGYWRFNNNGNGFFDTFRSARYDNYPTGMPVLGSKIFTVVSGTGTGSYFVTINGVNQGYLDPLFGIDISTIKLGRDSVGNFFPNSRINEVLLANSSFDDTIRTAIESFQNQKWAIY